MRLLWLRLAPRLLVDGPAVLVGPSLLALAPLPLLASLVTAQPIGQWLEFGRLSRRPAAEENGNSNRCVLKSSEVTSTNQRK